MDFDGVRVPQGSVVVSGIAQGTIAAGKTVTVRFAGVDVLCRAERGLTVAAGDVVYGLRINSQIIIIGRLHAAAPGGVDEGTGTPAPEPGTRTGRTVINPVETRSYRPNWGWRTDNDDVYQGEFGNNGNHIGCAFYGNKPRSLEGVEVTSASIRVRREAAGQFAAQQTTLKRIEQKTRPAGEPDFVAGTTDGPDLAVGASDSSFTIPDSWAQDLIDGDAGGLAIHSGDGSPYVRLSGRSWSGGWALTINWRRTT